MLYLHIGTADASGATLAREPAIIQIPREIKVLASVSGEGQAGEGGVPPTPGLPAYMTFALAPEGWTSPPSPSISLYAKPWLDTLCLMKKSSPGTPWTTV